MKINLSIKVLPGQKCIVQNYKRKNKPWENGKCKGTTAIVISKDAYFVFYDVLLDRRDKLGRAIKLKVLDDVIKLRE